MTEFVLICAADAEITDGGLATVAAGEFVGGDFDAPDWADVHVSWRSLDIHSHVVCGLVGCWCDWAHIGQFASSGWIWL